VCDGRRKKILNWVLDTELTKATSICRSQNKRSYLLHLLFLSGLSRFWAFRNKGVQKHGGGVFKVHLSSSKQNRGFFSFFCVCAFLDVVTRGVQKRDNKNRGNFPAATPKKVSTYVTFSFSFTAPLAFCRCPSHPSPQGTRVHTSVASAPSDSFHGFGGLSPVIKRTLLSSG
jgi:hypothetical protein